MEEGDRKLVYCDDPFSQQQSEAIAVFERNGIRGFPESAKCVNRGRVWYKPWKLNADNFLVTEGLWTVRSG